MKSETTNKYYLGIIMILIVLSGFMIYRSDKFKTELTESREGNKMILKLLTLEFGFDEDKTDAENYYNEASLNYERGNYLVTESKCKLARDSYSKHIQNVKKEQIETRNFTENIFKIYNNLLDEEIKISENMYEACEYFEEASRHFDYYYKSTTPSNDPSYEMGGKAIKSMNEKINAHDESVKKYNYLIEEFKIEKDKLIEQYS